MRFRELAWGAFLYANANRGTAGERIYDELIADISLLNRLQHQPELDDFQKIRDFIAHFGVHQIPTNFAAQELSPLWPTLSSHILTLADESLETADLDSPHIREAISVVFNWPIWTWGSGGSTVKSKVIHFFNVRLFMMWDEGISRPYFGPEGYAQFLRDMQTEAREAIADFHVLYPSANIEAFLSQNLGYTAQRPITKFIDQYNWITIARGWPRNPPQWLLESMS